MRIMTKVAKVFILFAVVVQLIILGVVGATEITNVNLIERNLVNEGLSKVNPNQTEPQIAPVLIWFGGVGVDFVGSAAGNAAITYYTGSHPEEWALLGIKTIESSIIRSYNWLFERNLHRNIYVSSLGFVEIRCAPDDKFCPITSVQPED